MSVCVLSLCVPDVLCLLRQINAKGIRTATELEAHELCTLSNLSLTTECGGKCHEKRRIEKQQVEDRDRKCVRMDTQKEKNPLS